MTTSVNSLCYCDKLMSFSGEGGCICNQNCYVVHKCDVCGPDGCADKVGNVSEVIGSAVNDAVERAGGTPMTEAQMNRAISIAHCGHDDCLYGHGPNSERHPHKRGAN